MMVSGEKSRVAQVAFSKDDSEELLVTPVGPNLYKLEESSTLGEVNYHDIIETETIAEGMLRCLRIVTPSELRTMSYVVPEALFESKRLVVLLDRVVSGGGNWERMFGGVLIFHVPPSEEPSIIGEMNAVLDEAGLSPRGGSRKDGV